MVTVLGLEVGTRQLFWLFVFIFTGALIIFLITEYAEPMMTGLRDKIIDTLQRSLKIWG
jgi:hypothetical protein